MKKRFGILALVLILIVAFTACQQQEAAPSGDAVDPAVSEGGSTAPETTTPAGSPLKIGVSVNATSNIHNQNIFEWAQEIGLERGHEIIATNGNGIAAQQATDIENLIQQGCDAIIVQNGDKDGLRNVIKQASDAGIYIISYETSYVDGVSVVFNMNEFAVASELYMMLVAEMGFEGDLIQVSHPDHPAVRSRRNVQEAILTEYSDLNSVNQITSAFPGTVEVTYRGVESALQANPNVKAIWCTQDLEAMGALQACQSLGRTDILMIGVDGEEDVLRHLMDGGEQIIATAIGDHWLGSTLAIEACETLVAGGQMPVFVSLPYDIVTSENAAEFLDH